MINLRMTYFLPAEWHFLPVVLQERIHWYTVELHVSEYWLSGSPIVRIGLALRVDMSRILQNSLALKLPFIGSSTVQCFGSWDFQSGVAESLRRKYIMQTVKIELQTITVAYFQRKIQLSEFSAYSDSSPS
jgi:uncharacterized protein YhdP